MSDKGDTAPQFTERELQLLGFAMRSLKSGPPEVSERPRLLVLYLGADAILDRL